MIVLLEYLRGELGGNPRHSPYKWLYDPDADTILLTYDPFANSKGMLIGNVSVRDYLTHMEWPDGAEEWLPEQ